MKKFRLIIIVCCTGLLLACSSRDIPYRFTGTVMGTSYSVQVVSSDKLSALKRDKLESSIANTLHRIDGLMSTYKPDSELMRFNALSVGKTLNVSSETAEVLGLALEVFEQSGGYFDPSIGPLVGRWGFGAESVDSPPNKAEVERLLSQAGMKHLLVERELGVITKLGEGFVDLSAIAKGYAVDQVADLLSSLAYSNFLVEVGGEVIAKGYNKHKKIWRLGVERPDFVGRKAYTVVKLANKAMATSGDYRNFIELDGSRYSHTIDPKSGYPIQSKLASVTVVENTCALADAWATGLNAMGFDKGLAFANQHGLSAYFIVRRDDGFEAFASSSFEGLVN